jgi:hypothetical protein
MPVPASTWLRRQVSDAVTFVVGDRTFDVRVARDEAPRSMTVTVVMDGDGSS